MFSSNELSQIPCLWSSRYQSSTDVYHLDVTVLALGPSRCDKSVETSGIFFPNIGFKTGMLLQLSHFAPLKSIHPLVTCCPRQAHLEPQPCFSDSHSSCCLKPSTLSALSAMPQLIILPITRLIRNRCVLVLKNDSKGVCG